MFCYICKNKSSELFTGLVLKRHDVKFYKCADCEFIQTDEPFWLEEAYSSAISSLDIGLVSRNINFSKILPPIIESKFDITKPMLDYGGGYGLFVRLLRDIGFNFFRQDNYCENLFAQNFDLSDCAEGTNFEVITAFEVFEHLFKPLDEIEKMFSKSNTVIFSTHLQPNQNISKAEDWGYFALDTGQHIAFYSRKTLEKIADIFGKKLSTNNINIHVISDEDFTESELKVRFEPRDPRSLIAHDVEVVRQQS